MTERWGLADGEVGDLAVQNHEGNMKVDAINGEEV